MNFEGERGGYFPLAAPHLHLWLQMIIFMIIRLKFKPNIFLLVAKFENFISFLYLVVPDGVDATGGRARISADRRASFFENRAPKINELLKTKRKFE